MSGLRSEDERLADVVVRFTDAFNRDDLDGEFNGWSTTSTR
jgi:hypothetical protein